MKLFAISDLHISHRRNVSVVESFLARPNDWLIVAGDVGETASQLTWTLRLLTQRFEQVVWVPGNHELWTLPNDPLQLRGEERYRFLIRLCRDLGVLTPEDPYPVLDCEGCEFVLAPLFVLYDYSFRPDGSGREEALAAAFNAGVVCTDEFYLHADPHPDRAAWCLARVRQTEQRLAAVSDRYPTVLVNHFPLRRDLAQVPRFPEFTLWCGTTLTEQWHRRFRATAVVSGHLHMAGTRIVDGARFEEVSLGYPEEWARSGPTAPRQVMPPVAATAGRWRA